MGIDRRRNYGIMLDTETANTIQDGDKLDMSNVLPYDFGWAVIDSKGNVYETHSFVNRDIFCYERDLMQSAYYADKIPRYIEDIKNGSRIMADLYEIRKAFCDCVERYNCSFVCAHNMRFDLNACNNAQTLGHSENGATGHRSNAYLPRLLRKERLQDQERTAPLYRRNSLPIYQWRGRI